MVSRSLPGGRKQPPIAQVVISLLCRNLSPPRGTTTARTSANQERGEGLGGVRAPGPRSHEPIVYLLHVRMLCPPLPHPEQLRLEPLDFFFILVFFAAMVAISYCYTVASLLLLHLMVTTRKNNSTRSVPIRFSDEDLKAIEKAVKESNRLEQGDVSRSSLIRSVVRDWLRSRR